MHSHICVHTHVHVHTRSHACNARTQCNAVAPMHRCYGAGPVPDLRSLRRRQSSNLAALLLAVFARHARAHVCTRACAATGEWWCDGDETCKRAAELDPYPHHPGPNICTHACTPTHACAPCSARVSRVTRRASGRSMYRHRSRWTLLVQLVTTYNYYKP